jgi:hypothetical protein
VLQADARRARNASSAASRPLQCLPRSGGTPFFGHVLVTTHVGALIWGGLYLRDPRVRALIPLRADEY